mmetsp:Transcript_25108/g.69260  ORF Transcript_25108/g.69260 Transcript_25108/m.69260 type:complete len:723 (-) Transcript_25108:57-2225(-)
MSSGARPITSARRKGSSAFAAGGSARPGSSARPTTSTRPAAASPAASSSRPAPSPPATTPTPSSTSKSKAKSSKSRKGRSGDRKTTSRSKDSYVPGSTKQGPQLDLMDIVSKRFTDDAFQSQRKAHPGWRVLIVDKPSMKVLSSVVGMYDLMEQHISSVESLELKRAPFQNLVAIYILAPTKSSVRRLIQDYEDKSKILYGDAVFVYFLGPIPKKLLKELTQCSQLGKRIKGLAELNVDFLVREQRAFTLDTKDTFVTLFQGSGIRPVEVKTAEKLMTLCVTLNEYPHVRFKQNSNVCTNVASIFQKTIDEYVGRHPNWWYHGGGNCPSGTAERDRSTLLLLDRSSDCLTPLMHDFNYQPLVNDLLQLDGDKITYKSESEEKEVLLNEKDKLWGEIRGFHIAKVLDIVSKRIREVTSSSTNNVAGNQKVSIGELASVLKELPQYREVMSKLSQHLSIASDCMTELQKRGLMELSELEQQLATGKDEVGRSKKLPEMIEDCEAILLNMKNAEDRLRLVLIVSISQGGLSGNDRDRLLRAAQLGREELQLLESLQQMGIKSEGAAAQPEPKKGFLGSFQKKAPDNDSDEEDNEYVSSRYIPPLKKILKDLVSNQLSTQEYPSVIPMPIMSNTTTGIASSARRRGKGGNEGNAKNRDKWGKKQSTDEPIHYDGGRNIVFMVGGLSFTELRVARNVMEKESREIISGGTKFVKPSDFIAELKTLVE